MKTWYSVESESNGKFLVDELLNKGFVDELQAKSMLNLLDESQTTVGNLKCQYCGKPILSVFDKWNMNQWWGYLGNQAVKHNTYGYSTVVQLLRKLGREAELYNVHARVHSKSGRNYDVICRRNSIRMLCNGCFRKTYRRIKLVPMSKFLLPAGVDSVEISVLPERGETVNSVLADLGWNAADFMQKK